MAMHPLTGRRDYVRDSPSWRARIEEYEKTLGYIICGVQSKKTGEPCLNKPEDGEHRCKQHLIKHDELKVPRDIPARTKWGMKLDVFMRCKRCKDDDCESRIDDRESRCPIEMEIYQNVMELAEKYKLGDFMEKGMLESVAFLFIKRFRAERFLATEGMVIEEIVAFDTRTGHAYTSKKAHPLLKSLSDINKELNQFADTLLMSPKSRARLKEEREDDDVRTRINEILLSAHKSRVSKVTVDDKL